MLESHKNTIFFRCLILVVCLAMVLGISHFKVAAKTPVVVINPGHAVGYDPGAVNGTTGVQEANLNAAIAAKTAKKLKANGYEVYLTHPVAGCSIPSLLANVSDANSLRNVGNAINAKNPDLALSIHHNSGGKTSSGYELYWSSYRDFDRSGVYEVSGLWGSGETAYRDSTPCAAAQQSLVFANHVQKAFEGFDIKYNKTVERDDYVPAHTVCPSILFEAGYVSNDSESRLLASTSHQEATADRLVNAVNDFFGKSLSPMTAQKVSSSTVDNGQFTVTVSGINAPNGVQAIYFPVWSNNGGQDDIVWHQASKKSDGSYQATIKIGNHHGDTGIYNIHCYGVDRYGKQYLLGNTSVNVPQMSPMTIKDISTSNIKNGKFTVTVSGIKAPSGVKTIQLPVWSTNGGQDDIIWYAASKKLDGTYQLTVDLKNHGYDIGEYKIHCYGINSYGKQEFLGNTVINVPQMTAMNVTASEVKNGKFTVTVSGINAPAGVKTIQLPVWSANGGQDDIIWYEAAKKLDGTYQLTIDLKNHGYDIGEYKIHCYGVDKHGRQQFLGNTVINVPQMTATNITASEVKNGKFTVTVSGINAPAGVKTIQLPTWSANGGQDDIIWYEASKSSEGTYQVVVNIKDHKKDTGEYKIHCYGTDSHGKQAFLGSIVVNIPSLASMSAQNVTTSEINDGKFTVTVTGINAPEGIKLIQIPTWSANGGQDDIIWYNAKRVDDATYVAEINIGNHKNDTGEYFSHVYGIDNNNKNTLLGSVTTVVPEQEKPSNSNQTPITAQSTKTKQQMIDYYNRNATFPSFYTDRGITLDSFVQMYIEEAEAEGIRAEVAFAQAMKETGFLRYGGDVKIEQYNFAGLGATGGVPGNSFPDVRTGIRAHVQHLKAYANNEPLVNACVDERFKYVKRGVAPYVEWLGIKENPNGVGWAAAQNYGYDIVKMIEQM